MRIVLMINEVSVYDNRQLLLFGSSESRYKIGYKQSTKNILKWTVATSNNTGWGVFLFFASFRKYSTIDLIVKNLFLDSRSTARC